MGSTINSKNLTAKDVLLKCKWFIEYNYAQDNEAEISVSWIKNGKSNIKWNPDTKTLYSDFHNYSLNIPSYATSIFAELWLKELAQKFKYPNKYLFYKYYNNRCKNLKFDIHLSEEEKKQEENFKILIDDIEKGGLLPIHLEFAKDLNVEEAFNVYMNSKYKINLEKNNG